MGENYRATNEELTEDGEREVEREGELQRVISWQTEYIFSSFTSACVSKLFFLRTLDGSLNDGQ